MTSKNPIKQINYEEKNKIYLITVQEKENDKDKESIEIYCQIKDEIDIYYNNKINFKKEYYYRDPLNDIVNSLKSKNVIITKDEGNKEIIMGFPLFFYSKKEYSSPNQNSDVIKTNEYDFLLQKGNNVLNLNILKDKKKFVFEFDKNALESIEMDVNSDIKINADKFKKHIENKKIKLIPKDDTSILLIKEQKNYSLGLMKVDDIKYLNLFNDFLEEKPKYNIKGITNIINGFNEENNKKFKRIEKNIQEMEDKCTEIKNISQKMKSNIEIMKTNAELMIFPKKSIKLIPEPGVEIKSQIIYKKKDFDLINNKLLQVYDTKKVKYELLYRASEHRDLAKIFKKKCNGVRGTLIIVKTENKRIFGGFTTQIWDDSERNYDDDKAFCFSADEHRIYELREYCSAIGCDFNSGPRFCWMFMINNKCMMEGGKLFREEVSHYEGQKRDYELNDGEEFFIVEELEAFKITED